MNRVKFIDSIKVKVKNPFFIAGIIGFIYNFFNAMGVEISTLTTWNALGKALIDFLSNPALIISNVSILLSIYTDASTPGLSDKK